MAGVLHQAARLRVEVVMAVPLVVAGSLPVVLPVECHLAEEVMVVRPVVAGSLPAEAVPLVVAGSLPVVPPAERLLVEVVTAVPLVVAGSLPAVPQAECRLAAVVMAAPPAVGGSLPVVRPAALLPVATVHRQVVMAVRQGTALRLPAASAAVLPLRPAEFRRNTVHRPRREEPGRPSKRGALRGTSSSSVSAPWRCPLQSAHSSCRCRSRSCT